jgi:putative ABC transport system substrate-binding protein
MKRRKFITLLGGAAAWPLAASAQQGDRVRRIGVLMSAAATEVEYQGYLAVQEMRRLGWSEGQNLQLDLRWTAGDAVLSHTYAAELIRLMPEVIVAASSVK